MSKNTLKNLITIVILFSFYLLSKLINGDTHADLVGIILKYTSLSLICISLILIPFKKNLYNWFF